MIQWIRIILESWNAMSDFINAEIATEAVAQKLLGMKLISETKEGRTSGWIVETEAYIGAIDQAAHVYQWRRTPRVEAMYQEPGTIYLYQMMGHTLLNIITKEEGEPQGVLVRAVEPDEGIELMKRRRQKEGYQLTDGPGKMSQAMGITMAEYGTLITEPPLYIINGDKKTPKTIEVSPRIGIPNKGEWTEAPLRYTVQGNPYVSKRKGKIDRHNYGWLK